MASDGSHVHFFKYNKRMYEDDEAAVALFKSHEVVPSCILIPMLPNTESSKCWELSPLCGESAHTPASQDEKSFRDLVVWLEDQKIRHYKIEDRGGLKGVEEKDWVTAYRRYLGSLNCPINPNERGAVLDWLLGLAVRFEYGDNVDKYKGETAENVRNRQISGPKMVNTNPLDSLDFQSSEFRDGVNRLASQLGVNRHPDHLVTLKAISKLITSRLSTEAIQNPGEVIHQGKAFPIFEADLGFETGDPVLNNAGKALRLMYIHDLRDLQTHINECIVAVQTITANPKTDTKLGKVGR